jgi:hypothetical protein
MAGLNTNPHLLSSSTKPESTPQDNTLSASSANFSQELQVRTEKPVVLCRCHR